MTEPMNAEAVAQMVADMKDGVHSMGMHEDNSTELFDIEGANDLMFEGGAMLEALAAENATLRASEAAAVARVAELTEASSSYQAALKAHGIDGSKGPKE